MDPEAVDQGTPDPGAEPNQPEQLSPYLQNFLNNVPEEHRPIVAQYGKQWDAGFTQYSQKVQNELKPYKELGDYKTVQQAMDLYNQFTADPSTVIDWVFERRDQIPAVSDWRWNHIKEQQQENQLDPAFQAALAPFQEKLGKLDQMEKALGAVGKWMEDQRTARQQAEEDRQLTEAMTQLHQQHGDFDDKIVLALASANGGDLEAAVQTFNATLQSRLNQRATAPAVLGGNSLPQLTKSTAEMTPEERKQTVMAALQNLQG